MHSTPTPSTPATYPRQETNAELVARVSRELNRSEWFGERIAKVLDCDADTWSIEHAAEALAKRAGKRAVSS